MQGNCGQSWPSFHGQKGHLVPQNFYKKLVKPHRQRAAPLSVTGHCAGRNFSFTSKALAAERSPWNAAGLSGAQPCSAHLITLGANRDHFASFCSPSTRKQHPGKHSLTEAAIQEQTWPTEYRKNLFFKHSKHISKTVKNFFVVGFSLQETPSLALLLPHSTLPLLRCPHGPPRAACLTQAGLHPSKPAHKQAPFIMQLSKPSLGQPNFTTTALAWLCCGQEPEPHHAPQPGGRAAPRSTHLF